MHREKNYRKAIKKLGNYTLIYPTAFTEDDTRYLYYFS